MKLLYRFIHYFGIAAGLTLFIKVKLNLLRSLHLPSCKHPFQLRPDTTDLAIFYQIFFNQSYDLNFTDQPKLIIDAGANIGLASIYFANKYPTASILAIEPHIGNYSLLQQNVSNYNVIPIRAALWSQTATMIIRDKGLGESGYVTELSTNTEGIQSVTISELMKSHKFDSIDILKIDIEGSEEEVFSRNFETWLPVTKCLIIETHDEIKSGSSKSVMKAISNYNFKMTLRGENLVFLNNDLL